MGVGKHSSAELSVHVCEGHWSLYKRTVHWHSVGCGLRKVLCLMMVFHVHELSNQSHLFSNFAMCKSSADQNYMNLQHKRMKVYLGFYTTVDQRPFIKHLEVHLTWITTPSWLSHNVINSNVTLISCPMLCFKHQLY